MSSRTVGLALAKYADADGTSCHPSQPTLATAAACSERTVRTALDELEAAGFVQIRRKGKDSGEHGRGQGWRRHSYVLTLPKRAEDFAAPSPQRAELTSAPHGERAADSAGEGAATVAGDLEEYLYQEEHHALALEVLEFHDGLRLALQPTSRETTGGARTEALGLIVALMESDPEYWTETRLKGAATAHLEDSWYISQGRLAARYCFRDPVRAEEFAVRWAEEQHVNLAELEW